MAGSRVVEYFIRARDETARAVRGAVVRVRSLYDGAKEAIRIKAKDETKPAAESAKKNISEVAQKALDAGKLVKDRVGRDGADGFRRIEDSAGRAATNIISQMAGIPGPVGGVLSQIGQMASSSFGGIAAAVTAAIAVIKKVLDSLAEKWRSVCQTIADNWRGQGQRLVATVDKMTREFEKADAAMQRLQDRRAAMRDAEADKSAQERGLARERELQQALAEGGGSERAEALRKAWEEEDKLVALERREAELVDRINDAYARNAERLNRRADIEEAVKSAEAAMRNVNAFMAERIQGMMSRGTWQDVKRWYAGDPEKEMEGAAGEKSRAALQALLKAYEQRERDEIAYGEDDAMAERLKLQLQGLDAEREAVGLAAANAEALAEAAKAEEEARKAEEEAAREAERAAQEELRRQEQLAREKERIERELAAERERLADQQYRKEVKLAQEAAQEAARAQSAAQSRLSAANARLAEAWTWYRDPTRMQARIDDYRQQQDAERRFEKDFERLRAKASGRFDWRTVEMGKLSAEEEAVRQVALAKEEQQAAQKALDAIEQNTRDLAEKLDELMSMKEA